MAESAGNLYGVEATPGVLRLYARFGPGYPWWVAAVAMIGSFATLLTATTVNVAIPDIMGALGLTLDQVHVFMDGRIVRSGGRELAERLEKDGYDWVKAESGAQA